MPMSMPMKQIATTATAMTMATIWPVENRDQKPG
jgi:hypothetical protein